MSMFQSIDPLLPLSGFLVGLLVGQTGMGGGSLMTPILMLLFNVHPATAVGTDLLYAAMTKTVGTLVHGMHDTVNWRVVARLASGSVPATAVTLLLLAQFGIGEGSNGGGLISTVLGITLLLTALSLVLRQRFVAVSSGLTDRLSSRQTAMLTVLTGATLGVLVAISSVGAGAIGVTALLLLYPRVPMRVIVGSDIAHAVPLTLVAGVGHWWLGSVDGLLLGSLLLGSVPGIVLGSWLSVRVPEWVLRPILALTLAVVGGRLVF